MEDGCWPKTVLGVFEADKERNKIQIQNPPLTATFDQRRTSVPVDTRVQMRSDRLLGKGPLPGTIHWPGPGLRRRGVRYGISEEHLLYSRGAERIEREGQ